MEPMYYVTLVSDTTEVISKSEGHRSSYIIYTIRIRMQQSYEFNKQNIALDFIALYLLEIVGEEENSRSFAAFIDL